MPCPEQSFEAAVGERGPGSVGVLGVGAWSLEDWGLGVVWWHIVQDDEANRARKLQASGKHNITAWMVVGLQAILLRGRTPECEHRGLNHQDQKPQAKR